MITSGKRRRPALDKEQTSNEQTSAGTDEVRRR